MGGTYVVVLDNGKNEYPEGTKELPSTPEKMIQISLKNMFNMVDGCRLYIPIHLLLDVVFPKKRKENGQISS